MSDLAIGIGAGLAMGAADGSASVWTVLLWLGGALIAYLLLCWGLSKL